MITHSETPSGLAGHERVLLAILAALSLVLRAIAFFHYRFDSDEPQHLHVAWGWTAGLIQYRDLFDNHAPLFHMMSAPLLGWLGERPDILLYMRAPMLPLWAVVIAGTWILGRRMYDDRVAVWAAILLSLFTPFFLKSLEYRNDNPWNALWMIALVVLTAGRITPLRVFVTGLIIGTAATISLKTTLLIFTLALSGLATYVLTNIERSPRRIISIGASFLAGAALVPAVLVIYFRSIGVWPNLVYCVFTFNAQLSEIRHDLWLHHACFPFALGVVLASCWRQRGRVIDDRTRWRYFFATALAMFIICLLGFWILISPRDYVPVLPLVAIFITAAVLRRPRPVLVLTVFCVICAFATIRYGEFLHDATKEHITMMNQVLALSRPGEPLMDLKGETVYRRRPFYYIFEYITRNQMLAGMLPDTIPEDVVRARCYVAQADGPFFPDRGRAFLNENFMDMGRLRAAGQWIRPDGSFTIAVPGEYTIVGHDGQARGVLDGVAFEGPRQLAAGPHRFNRAAGGQRVAVLWAPAFARGFSPFHLKDRDF